MDQYSRIKRISEYAKEEQVHFIKVHLTEQDAWSGKTIMELRLPYGMIVAAIQRDGHVIVPSGDVVLQVNDTLVLGAPSYGDLVLIEGDSVILYTKMHMANATAFQI